MMAAALAAAGAGCGKRDITEFGESAGVGGNPGPPLEELIEPAPGGMRHLLARQYQSSVRLVLGDAAAAAAKPPTDIQLHGFAAIGATALAMSTPDITAYEISARDVADAVTKDAAGFATLLPCKPTGIDDAVCLGALVSKIGPLLWRRPLKASENGAITAIAVDAAKTYKSFEKGAAYAISALLQAPDFLYIIEIGEPDPKNKTRRVLTQIELATRMAFFLTDTTPDAALLELAQKGKLNDEAAVRAAAKSMIGRPEAKKALGSFYEEVFRFDQLSKVAKNAELYPTWQPAMQKSVHDSALALLDDIVWTRNADAREMLTADYAFVDSQMAQLYGVSSPASGMVKVTLPAKQQRNGLLGSPAFLAIYSHAARSSPTKRGVFIRRTLLCDSVPNPPPDVVAVLPDDPKDGLTTKEVLQKHIKNDSCKGCHNNFDSLGWSLENFDAIGAFRLTDQGKPIDTSGESSNIGTFAGPNELAKLLYAHYQVPDCMIRNLFRNSMGHLETKGEEPAIDALHVAFEHAGFKVQDLLVEIVASPAFRLVGDPK